MAMGQPPIVHLKARDGEGRAVTLESAYLLMDVWGGTRDVELSPSGDELTLVLNQHSTREWWPEAGERLEHIYLYLRAEGYADVLSHSFQWPGASVDTQSEDSTEITFESGGRTRIGPGQEKDLEVLFRRPQARFLQLLDGQNRPVQGVDVRALMFWSSNNHCGYPAGKRLLLEGSTDARGQLEVPDGDHPYAFQFLIHYNHPLRIARPKARLLPPRIEMRLEQRLTVIRVERLEPTRVRILDSGKPASGKRFHACLANCFCGACCNGIGIVSAAGWVEFDAPFYRQHWRKAGFRDEKGYSWETDPRTWPNSPTVQFDVSESK